MNIAKIIKIQLLILLVILFASSLAHAEEKPRPRLAILPFTMNNPEDLAHLQEGVRAMLASRVAAGIGAILVDRHEAAKVVSEQSGISPQEAGRVLGADLVLTGSVTGLGSSLSIDAILTRVKEGDSESFFTSAADQNSIIAAVDRLAADISGSISGEPRQVEQATAASSVAKPGAVSTGSSDQTMHPDRIFRAPVSAVPVPAPSITTTSPFLPPVTKPAGQASRSQFLDLEIQVMDAADVFGEGSSQVVLAEKQRVTVYRQDGGRLTKAAEVPAAPRHVRIVSLCLADLNGNGRAEIYVSAISDNTPLSYAVEWDGKAFVSLYNKQRWYTRTLFLPGKGMVLAGQQGGSDYPVKPGIYQLTVGDGELVKGEKLAIPEAVNLFDFVLGDFTGDGQTEIAVQSQDDHLYLYNKNGDVLWEGAADFGHTSRYIGPASASLGDQENLQVPTRLVALDLNGDGRQELVAMKNPSGLGTIMRTVGSFVGGSIDIMAWNGITFNEYWSTGPIGSYIASYQLEATEGRLYLALINKSKGLILSTMRSTVASYGLANIPQ